MVPWLTAIDEGGGGWGREKLGAGNQLTAGLNRNPSDAARLPILQPGAEFGSWPDTPPPTTTTTRPPPPREGILTALRKALQAAEHRDGGLEGMHDGLGGMGCGPSHTGREGTPDPANPPLTHVRL